MRLLLDAHIAKAVSRELRQRGIDALALPEWQSGNLRSASDETVLAAARADGRVLVTFDCRSVAPLLRDWAVSGQHHAGVILVDQHTFHANEVRQLVRALAGLAHGSDDPEWQDRVIYLRRRQTAG